MLKFISVLFIFVLLATGVVYFVFRSSFFQVAGVEVVGSQRAEEIKGGLISALSKISRFRSWFGPENLLFWFPKTPRIPPSLFWLSDLSLERNWRQKKIIIGAKERQPWLLWCLYTQANSSGIQAGLPAQASSSAMSSLTGEASSTAVNNCYWLDDQGIVFAFAPEAEGFIIPKVFEEDDRQQLVFGQPFYNNPQLVKNTLEIIKQLKNSSLVIRRFSIKNINFQELETETDGPKLYFSLRSLPQELDRVLTNLANRLDFLKLEYIDFRVENRIYYK